MKKTAIFLMLITILSKIIGFVRDIILSYFYGASNISDVYLISQTIPVIIFGFIGAGIMTAYIPMYIKIEQEYGKDETEKYTNNLVNIIILISTIIIVICLFFTSPIVKMFASGFEGETLKLAIKFTRISLFGIYFIGMINIFSGYLETKGAYLIPALIGFPLNLIIIISIILSNDHNILILAIGSVIATASQLIILLPFLYKKKYRYRFVLNLKDQYIKKMFIIVLPVILGVSVTQINMLVARTIASNMSIGGISAINYATRVNDFVQGIFVISLVTIMYPLISRLATEGKNKELKKAITNVINVINIIILPITILTMIFSTPIVIFLFGRGAFDSNAVKITSNALFYFSLGMLSFGWREILTRAFYSLQDTKTPMKNSAISMGINILLNIILSKFLGVGGLALGTSLSSIICTLLLFKDMRKRVGPLQMKGVMQIFLKTLISAILMGIIAKLLYNIMNFYFINGISLIFSMGISVILYIISLLFMKIDSIDTFILGLKSKYKKASI